MLECEGKTYPNSQLCRPSAHKLMIILCIKISTRHPAAHESVGKGFLTLSEVEVEGMGREGFLWQLIWKFNIKEWM
jgi:hypothetical protein